MFNKLLLAPTEFFLKSTAAHLINAVVFEVNNVLSILGTVAINLVRDSLTVIGLLGYLLYLNWKLTMFVIIIFPIIAGFVALINKRLRKLNRQQQDFTSQLAYVVEEASAGHKVVKLNSGQDYEMYRFYEMAKTTGMETMQFKATILDSAMPLGLTPYVLSVQYKLESSLVARIVVLATLLSIIIIPLWLVWLG